MQTHINDVMLRLNGDILTNLEVPSTDTNERRIQDLSRALEESQKKVNDVRSLEDGFLGSWHLGTVIDCDDLVRQVKYHHLLSDDGSGKLVENVHVSPIFDGVVPAADEKPVHYRGILRPLPPQREFSSFPLTYGQCVDLFYQCAWWEGVIFDREDGAKERRIFFPDMGDEMKVQVDKLRITQDWDEVTEEWKPRGSWMFLDVIEEIEHLRPLSVSVKQIWYELQLKKDYEHLKEWMSSSRDVWRDLVKEVVHDNTKLAVKQFLSELNSSQDFIEGDRLLEFSEPVLEAKLNLETYFDSSITPLTEAIPESETLPMDQDVSNLQLVEKQFVSEDFVEGGRLLEFSEPVLEAKLNLETYFDSSIAPLTEAIPESETLPMDQDVSNLEKQFVSEDFAPTKEDVMLRGDGVRRSILPRQNEESYISPHAFSGLPPPTSDITGTLSSTKSKTLTFTKRRPRRGRPPTEKKSVEEQTTPVGEPDFCLNTIAKSMPSISSTKKFKRHLLYLGWKFQLMMECGVIKKSYIAPNGEECQSLGQVWQVLEKSKASGLVPPVDQRSLSKSTDNSIQSPCVAEPEPCKEDPELPSPSEEAIVDPEASEEAIVDPEASEEAIIDPEICPQAVIDYCSPTCKDIKAYQQKYKQGMTVADTCLKAKKHLAAIGWSIYYVGKKDPKLRFCSPEGKMFTSLRKACRWCAQEWKAESHLPHPVSSPSTAMEFQSHLSPSKNSNDKSLVGTSPISQLRDTVQYNEVKFRRVTKRRKKRKHGDEEDTHISGLPVLERKKSRPSLKGGDGVVPSSSVCDMRSSKRARQPSPSSFQTPRTVLSWLIDNNMILLHAKVQYRVNKYGDPLGDGQITREGIKCNCCQKIYGLRNFEIHAGSSCHTPSANIFLEDGRSLLECQKQQMKSKKSIRKTRNGARAKKTGSHFSTNDYICSVCHEGGKLVLCDECPSSFHPGCLGMKEVPDGDWFCPSCCCKVCGESGFDNNRNHFTDNSVLICCQCEHKYHARCMRSKGHTELENYPEGNWFCNKRCELISLGMHHLLGKPVIVGGDKLTWTLLKYIKPDDSGSDVVDSESSVENYSRLCVALEVMHECFEPVKERHTRRDIVEDVIFSRWSELNRLNFQGFYTVLLERNDEVITVATVRVYGEKVAEIPLVATRFQHRRLGMCRILMNELEKTFVDLGVERLVLPAVPAVLDTWTTSFGFSVMKESERVNFLDYTFLDFQGTVMCQKILQKIPSVVSSVLTDSQQTHFDNINSDDNVDLDGNAAVSAVSLTKRIESCKIVDQDQGSLEYVSSLLHSIQKVEEQTNRTAIMFHEEQKLL